MKYTLYTKSEITIKFTSQRKKQYYIWNEIKKINNDENSNYFLFVSNNDIKYSNELKLVKFTKAEKSCPLEFLDYRTFEAYKTNPDFNPSDFIIAYKLNGIRTLDLVAKDSEDYFNEDFLSDRINSLITSRKMKVTAITCLACVAKAKDMEATTDEIAKIQGNYDEKISDLTGMDRAVKKFVKALNINDNYRRYRDVALFIYNKDKEIKEKEVAQAKVNSIEIKSSETPTPIEVIGEHVTQTSLFGPDVPVIKYTKAGTQSKRQ